MADFTFITFATLGTEYVKFAHNWGANMERLDLPHVVNVIDPESLTKKPTGISDGYYKRWVGRKVRVEYIRSKLEELNRPIIWMDCDDGLTGKPELPDEEFDFGYMRNPTKARKRLPIIAGLLAFHPTTAAYHFLDVWEYLCAWDDLEPMGGNHIRLIHAFNICNDVEARKRTGFQPKNLTPYFEPYWDLDGNRG